MFMSLNWSAAGIQLMQRLPPDSLKTLHQRYKRLRQQKKSKRASKTSKKTKSQFSMKESFYDEL